MTHPRIYTCRITRALMSNVSGETRKKFHEMLRLVIEEWKTDPGEIAVQLMTDENGVEIELQVEDDGADCTVNARIEHPGVYSIDNGAITLRNIPETLAMKAVSGNAKPSDFGGELLAAFQTDTVIRKGLIYKDGEKVDDLTKICQSDPPWDKDMSLTLCFVDDEDWQPIDIPDGKGNFIRNCPLIRLFLEEASEDFLSCYRYVLEKGETEEGDEEHVLFRRGEVDHAVNGEILATEHGKVLHVFLVIGVTGRFYLKQNEATIYAMPSSAVHTSQTGRRFDDIMETSLAYPPADTLVTASRPSHDGGGLVIKFDAD